MTLDEAIKHCEEKAKELRTPRAYIDIEGNLCATEICDECAREHEQLAKWLKQLNEVEKIVEHWNDEKSTFVAACDAFEEILKIFNLGIKP